MTQVAHLSFSVPFLHLTVLCCAVLALPASPSSFHRLSLTCLAFPIPVTILSCTCLVWNSLFFSCLLLCSQVLPGFWSFSLPILASSFPSTYFILFHCTSFCFISFLRQYIQTWTQYSRWEHLIKWYNGIVLLSALFSVPCFLYNVIFFSFVTVLVDMVGIFMEMSTFGLWREEFESIKEVTAGSCTTSSEM